MSEIILITGATELAKKGNHVIIHGRNEQKAKQTVAEIKQQAKQAQVEYLIADLFSLPAVKQIADKFQQKYDHLDVLINNAGAVLDDTRRETDGIENTMALNVLAPFLLNQLLLPSLEKSTDGRIINMSSGTHRQAKPDMNDLNLEKESSGQKRYGISKLFVIWNSQHLAVELQKQGITNVTVNCSHPGAVATKFGQDSDNGFFVNLIFKTASAVFKILFFGIFGAQEKGLVTNIYLSFSFEVRELLVKF